VSNEYFMLIYNCLVQIIGSNDMVGDMSPQL